MTESEASEVWYLHVRMYGHIPTNVGQGMMHGKDHPLLFHSAWVENNKKEMYSIEVQNKIPGECLLVKRRVLLLIVRTDHHGVRNVSRMPDNY
jgi:hypothetical protein